MMKTDQEMNPKKTLIFAVAGYNLAETSRHIEIARACRGFFNIIFLSYGGKFENLIEEQGFTVKKMEPRLTKKKLERLAVVLSGETWNTVGYFNATELEPRVENEIKFFKEIKPAAVLTGWCLSVTVSTRAAKVPFVNVLHSTSIQEYYKAGLQTWPDRIDYSWLRRLIGQNKLNARINKRILKTELPVKPYNKIGKKYGVKKFHNFLELLEGDYTLLADIPEWVGLSEIRPNLYYIGPLPARIDKKIPKEIVEMPKDKPIVYFAMGSSGKPKLIKEIIEGFKGKPYYVIAPVESHIKDMAVEIPSNVLVTGFLPAHKVNPMADISVIHGGQNTVMQACLSGTPIIGMGMHPEQEANIETCVRKGFAIRLNKWKIKASEMLEVIDTLLHDNNAKKKVKKFQHELMKWDGPSNAAKFLYETFRK
jgi:UDP:flavonoid glycosyltransferase YjiC (YdhE family)